MDARTFSKKIRLLKSPSRFSSMLRFRFQAVKLWSCQKTPWWQDLCLYSVCPVTRPSCTIRTKRYNFLRSISGRQFVNLTESIEIVWAFRRLKKPRSREMSARGYALHSVCHQLSFSFSFSLMLRAFISFITDTILSRIMPIWQPWS